MEATDDYLDLSGALWYARPDVVNVGVLRDGSKPWEFGCVTIDVGAEIWGDWMTEAEARHEVAARRADDARWVESVERRDR
jgi:hypothetical protein